MQGVYADYTVLRVPSWLSFFTGTWDGRSTLAVVFDETLHLSKYKIKLKPQGNTSAQILTGFPPFKKRLLLQRDL